MRVSIAALFENLEDGAQVSQFVEWFTGVSSEQARAVLEHAARSTLTPAWVRVLFDQEASVPLRESLKKTLPDRQNACPRCRCVDND